MKKSNRVSFQQKIRISLGLMGIIPFLVMGWFLYQEKISLSNTIIISAALLLFLILLGFVLLRQSADQVNALVKKTSELAEETVANDIADKELDFLDINSNFDGEFAHIAKSFNTMVQKLSEAQHELQEQSSLLVKYTNNFESHNELLNQEESLRQHLSRYVDSSLVQKFIDSANNPLDENTRKTVTVMFVDIRSFSVLAETMEPEEVVSMLNEYFSIMVEIIFSHGGMLDKLVGDQIMAAFGHIEGDSNGVEQAVRAAVDIQKANEKLMEKRKAAGLKTFGIGIGINTGDAILGNVGSKNRQDYTLIGDMVNIAAKIERVTKEGDIFIGEEVYLNLPDDMEVEKKFHLSLKDRTKPTACYKLKYS